LGDCSIADPIYGVDRTRFDKTAPYLPNSIDVMAVGNLPNELPRDASRYFGEQLIKYVLDDIRVGGSSTIDHATMIKSGAINEQYAYLKEYGGMA
ncbi:MAG: alanine dehydrogenase, partial [Chitinophagaceae bacterium]